MWALGSSILEKHSLDVVNIACSCERKHQENSGFLRIQIVPRDQAEGIVFFSQPGQPFNFAHCRLCSNATGLAQDRLLRPARP